MDLIYADVEKGIIIDRGVLNTYKFDCSFGEKENDFELTFLLAVFLCLTPHLLFPPFCGIIVLTTVILYHRIR